jgi:hypothetical protein
MGGNLGANTGKPDRRFMSDVVERLEEFARYASILKGDEKGEAQVFCDRLFIAFGHKGYKEAGAELEFRIKKKAGRGTSFADLIWKPRVLMEMKKRGEKLFLHHKQAFEYWIHADPNRPKFMALCNFDEIWIYDFDKQIDTPVDTVAVTDLPRRYPALNFLFPDNPDSIFGNDREAVSREAADKVAALFNALVARGIDRQRAQRFALQMVVAMFAEDIDLLPAGMVYGLVDDSRRRGQKPYDLFGGLSPWCTDQRGGRTDPDPVRSASRDADVLRASELEHAVQDAGSNGHFGRLTPVRVRAQRIADHPLPAGNVRLDQGAPTVSGCLLPAHAAALGDALQMPVASRRRDLGRPARHLGLGQPVERLALARLDDEGNGVASLFHT